MIYQVMTDFPDFQPVELGSGINIILAKRVNNSTNGLGKTLLIACIDFVLGADYKKSVLIEYPELQNITIKLVMDYKGEKIEALRKLDKVQSKKIKINYLSGKYSEDVSLNSWRKELLIDKFSYNGNLSMLSWRSLLKFFIKKDTVNSFEQGLKGFQGDNGQKTSVYQSFLLDIAFKEFEKNYLSSSLVSDGRNLTSYVNKLKSVIDTTPELEADDIEDYSKFQDQLSSEMNRVRSSLIMSQNKLDLFSLELEKLKESRDYIDNVVENTHIEDLYSILTGEMEQFVRKNFDEAKEFHQKLLIENKSVINTEIEKTNTMIKEYKRQTKLDRRKLKELLLLKEERNNSLSTMSATSLVINELVSKPSNEISKEVNERVGSITESNTKIIQDVITANQEIFDRYQTFLAEHVNEVYETEKDVTFKVSYDKILKIIFSYDDDSGTGKSNMKLLIYYYLVLIVNHAKLSRNIDMLIVDTDFTDGIDSNNLLRFFNSIEKELIENNCQLILTLKDDRSIPIEETVKDDWIKRVLLDEQGGYLFKKGLIKD